MRRGPEIPDERLTAPRDRRSVIGGFELKYRFSGSFYNLLQDMKLRCPEEDLNLHTVAGTRP